MKHGKVPKGRIIGLAGPCYFKYVDVASPIRWRRPQIYRPKSPKSVIKRAPNPSSKWPQISSKGHQSAVYGCLVAVAGPQVAVTNTKYDRGPQGPSYRALFFPVHPVYTLHVFPVHLPLVSRSSPTSFPFISR